jgi:phosphoribosylformylglycinamidine synthase
MGQFVGAIDGMREACAALDYPVVSGNVSLYNETNGAGILPTPTIGGVGLLEDASKMVTMAFKAEGEAVVLIGETAGHLGATLYLREVEGRDEGAPPPVDLAAERKNGDFVRAQIGAGALTACHDLSGGGLGVGLAKMAVQGGLGAIIEVPADAPAFHAWAFGEDQARYVVTTKDADALLAAAAEAGVPATRIGATGGQELTFGPAHHISVAELRDTNESWLPDFMAADAHMA